MWQSKERTTAISCGALSSIRPLTVDDAEIYCRVQNDKEIRRYIGPALNIGLEETRRRLGQPQATDGLYVIDSNISREPIGCCGFVDGDHGWDIWISLRTEFQGGGIGREVLATLRDIWITERGHEKCCATVAAANQAAIKLLESCMFERVSIFNDLWGVERYKYCYVA